MRITPYLFPFRYPFPSADVVDFFIAYYGPTVRAFHSLDDTTKAAFKEDLKGLWSTNNRATDGTTEVLSEYVEVVGTRA